MKQPLSWLLLAALNLLLPIGILIFAKGFFPYKPFLPGLAIFDNETDQRIAQTAPFDKVILMVVDALRSDFVFSKDSGFHFVQSLISNGRAIPFTAHAAAPTVTMPRVKALTTGSIPSFLDVILNIAESDTSSSLASQDTWLAQIRARGGNLTMFGDDTWLKLFPGMFERSDGTASFFVSDFTEVDNNVTRHIDTELEKPDWNAMVLHYLGVDHIGHKSGPRGHHMIPKQKEMDGIVERLYDAISKQPHLSSTLLVLCGDHGMNDAGNHGGAGPGESSPALVFASPKFQAISGGQDSPVKPTDEFRFYRKVEQSDVVPSLAGLMGFPIPKNNLGIFIRDFLGLWDGQTRISLVASNAKQLSQIARETFANYDAVSQAENCPSLSTGDELACLWNRATLAHVGLKAGEFTEEDVLDRYYKFSEECQNVLSTTASNYNIKLMTTGAGVIGVAIVILASLAYPIFTGSALDFGSLFTVIVLNAVIMFASSFVEEEQQFWYWLASGWWILVALKERRSGQSGIRSLGILALTRILRRWNQTGQKHAGAPDIVRTFFPGYPSLLWALIFITYTSLFSRLAARAFRAVGREMSVVLSISIVTANAGFKVASAAMDSPEMIPPWLEPVVQFLKPVSLVIQAQTAFLALTAGVVITLVDLRPSKSQNLRTTSAVLHDLLSLFLATQSRFTDIPILLFSHFQALFLEGINILSPVELSLTLLILQRVSFFMYGGSNAISSVDLSNAYNGVSGYNVSIIGILTFISNWIGPIFWTSVGAILLSKRSSANFSENYKNHAAIFTLFELASVVAVMTACTALRTHLFIWTVFSPKFLYSMAWSLGHHIGVTILCGGLIALVSGRRRL